MEECLIVIWFSVLVLLRNENLGCEKHKGKVA